MIIFRLFFTVALFYSSVLCVCTFKVHSADVFPLELFGLSNNKHQHSKHRTKQLRDTARNPQELNGLGGEGGGLFLRIDTESGKSPTRHTRKKNIWITDLTSSHLFRSAVRLVGMEVPLVFWRHSFQQTNCVLMRVYKKRGIGTSPTVLEQFLWPCSSCG